MSIINTEALNSTSEGIRIDDKTIVPSGGNHDGGCGVQLNANKVWGVTGVVLANAAALAYWDLHASEMIGADAHVLMADIRRRTTGAPMMPPGALLAEPHPITGEGMDAQRRSLLLRCVRSENTADGRLPI